MSRLRSWLGAAAHRGYRVFGSSAVVLMYHRIADDPSDPYGLCVSPRHFEEHLSVIRELGRPLRLAELAAGLRRRSVPRRAICVTFDDGYADNLQTAAPLLARHDVRALVFVTTGPGGRRREFWWDELERIFLQPGELPDRLEIEIDGRPLRLSLGGASRYTPEQQERHRAWHLLDPAPPTERHAALRQVYDRVLPLAVEPRSCVVDALVAWAGLDPETVRPDRRAMEPEEVASLADSGLDVGAHTVNHPALPSQTADVQRAEMEGSRQTLEQWTGQPVAAFAYPYGFRDPAVVAGARRSGFDFACAGDYRAVTRFSKLWELPRIEAPAADGDALGRILHRQLA